MSACPQCGSEISLAQRFCPACGTALVPSSQAGTVAMPARARVTRTSSSSADLGRWPPGTVLAQRYRIAGRIGSGGMGEVYRAYDLILAQDVALKFLPDSFAGSEAALERFRNEVRLARQVSHPNVCRVYDIGEVEGAPFLSMEYVILRFGIPAAIAFHLPPMRVTSSSRWTPRGGTFHMRCCYILVVLALGAAAFRLSLDGRKLLSEEVLA